MNRYYKYSCLFIYFSNSSNHNKHRNSCKITTKCSHNNPHSRSSIHIVRIAYFQWPNALSSVPKCTIVLRILQRVLFLAPPGSQRGQQRLPTPTSRLNNIVVSRQQQQNQTMAQTQQHGLIYVPPVPITSTAYYSNSNQGWGINKHVSSYWLGFGANAPLIRINHNQIGLSAQHPKKCIILKINRPKGNHIFCHRNISCQYHWHNNSNGPVPQLRNI